MVELYGIPTEDPAESEPDTGGVSTEGRDLDGWKMLEMMTELRRDSEG